MFWLAPLILVLVAFGIRRIQEGNKGVVIRLGTPTSRVIGPGIAFVLPFVDRIHHVPVEPFSVSLPPQSAITKDEIPIQLQASLDGRMIDPVLGAGVRDWRIHLVSQLQQLMKDGLEDLDFDHLDEVFPSWIESLRKELSDRVAEIGVEIVDLRISNLSPRTKP